MDEMQVLRILENNPRATIADLADIVNASEEDVIRVKSRLEEEKIICGYHTVINWDKTNNEHMTAIILVKATPEKEVGYDRVAKEIARFDEVTDLFLMSGGNEFVVTIEGRTMREVSDFVAKYLATIEGVTSTVTSFQLQKYKVDGVKLYDDEYKDDRLTVQK